MKEIKNFAVLEGIAEISDGKVIFREVKSESKETKDMEVATVRTDVSFSNGIVDFKVKFRGKDAGCVLLFEQNDEFEIVGYSKDFQQFVVPNTGGNNNAGNLGNYDLQKPLSFRIEIKGSTIKLYVNNILMCSGTSFISEQQLTFRISGEETTLFDVKFEAIKPKVFIIMQFTPEYNELYSDVIKPVCESYDLETIRADEFYTSTPIIKDIIDSIEESYIIIAEITPDNPNVFYEIGYAHAIKKPTILLCDRKRERLPFDVSGFRTLFYENSIGGKNKVERDLKKFISGILK